MLPTCCPSASACHTAMRACHASAFSSSNARKTGCGGQAYPFPKQILAVWPSPAGVQTRYCDERLHKLEEKALSSFLVRPTRTAVKRWPDGAENVAELHRCRILPELSTLCLRSQDLSDLPQPLPLTTDLDVLGRKDGRFTCRLIVVIPALYLGKCQKLHAEKCYRSDGAPGKSATSSHQDMSCRSRCNARRRLNRSFTLSETIPTSGSYLRQAHVHGLDELCTRRSPLRRPSLMFSSCCSTSTCNSSKAWRLALGICYQAGPWLMAYGFHLGQSRIWSKHNAVRARSSRLSVVADTKMSSRSDIYPLKPQSSQLQITSRDIESLTVSTRASA